jgi:hypothetical protein
VTSRDRQDDRCPRRDVVRWQRQGIADPPVQTVGGTTVP